MILVIAEHDNQLLKSSTLNTITAAAKLDDEVAVLVAGFNCDKIAKLCANIHGVKKVILANAQAYEHQLAENISKLIIKLATNFKFILAPGSTSGKNILPRVAALLGVAQVSDVIEIIAPDTFVRPIYAGNALATVKVQDAIKVLTIRTTAFAAAVMDNHAAPIECCELIEEAQLSKFIKRDLSISARPELTAAKAVVSGGRGMQSAEKFKLLEELADCLGAAIGASRAAVDAGYVPNDYQVGQTGKIVAPQLYIALGISGAIQHLAGIKDSKVIVAINKDSDAPIFQVADFGLVGDLFEILPQLVAEIKKRKK